MRRGLPASALARHLGRGPGDTEPRGRPSRATRAPCPSPRAGTAAAISRGGDRSRCLSAAETHTLTHSRSPRHHNLNPSPTLRELQVTDHVGLTPGPPGAPTPLPPPARVLQDRTPSSAKPPREGSSAGRGGERREIDPPSPRPLPLAPPASPPPRHPAPRCSPAPSSLHSRSRAAPGDIFSRFFLLHF